MTDRADRLYEQVLVLRCQAGNEAAFAELVERYRRRLRYYVRKMLGEGQRAQEMLQDVVQDVWFEVFRGLPRLNDPNAFAAWFYRIARDRAYLELRRLRPPPVPLRETDLVDVSDEDKEEFAPEDVVRVHAALDQLPPEYREVLVLRFLEEMPYQNMALVIGCPLGTIRSRLHYAKRALRRVLETKGYP